ncbi:MAG: OsmC family peroxiredoxin [Hyphomicrobiales bacterium]|nr:MAG: OsmC family peroxiredoxin [Hyphomicrobiales bacterium]
MLEYALSAARRDASGSLAVVRDATVELDTSLAGRVDALNPVELLLAALAACMIKGVERSAPMLGFVFRSVDIRLHAARQDAPPKLLNIGYSLTIDTDEPDRRLQLLHTNVRKYGTISNTLAAAVTLTGTVGRKG